MREERGQSMKHMSKVGECGQAKERQGLTSKHMSKVGESVEK